MTLTDEVCALRLWAFNAGLSGSNNLQVEQFSM